MAKKCIYCTCEISDTSVIDFCEKCGKGVWGEKMFNTIVSNMEQARDKGDLCHHHTSSVGDISENPVSEPTSFEGFGRLN